MRLPSDTGSLCFEYLLGSKYIYPYAGVSFEPDSAKAFLDLSGYDMLEVEIEATLSRRIPVVITQDVKGYSTVKEGASFRPLNKEIIYERGQRAYQLPLSAFETPAWWFSNRHVTEHEVGKPDLSRVHSIQLQECDFVPVGIKEKFTVYRLIIYKDLAFWYLSALALLITYYGVWAVLLYFKKSAQVVLPRKELVVGNLADEESQKVVHYIAENYQNPQLSLELLQKDLGLSDGKISAITKNNTGLNFKAYLNRVRLEEAKRLLRETDRPIMDIAYKVGYGNVPHFNRVFKESEHCSPNEYRKTAQGNR